MNYLCILDLFGRSLKGGSNARSFRTLNEKAIQRGYIVADDACNADTEAWLDNIAVDYNATFYKSFQDVVSRSRLELLFDQLVHYMTTYGTGFQGEAWVPNDEVAVIPFTSLKVISSIDASEVKEGLDKMISSGAALKQDTINKIIDAYQRINAEPDINICANKELMCVLCDRYNKIPENGVNLVRYIVYKAIGRTLLIKDDATIGMMRGSRLKLSSIITNSRAEYILSTVFLRYKKLLIALKHNSYGRDNSKIINRIRKMADRNKIAMKPSELSQVINYVRTHKTEAIDWDGIQRLADGVNNYKIISLINTIVGALTHDNTGKIYRIRNGKFYMDEHWIASLDTTGRINLVRLLDIMYNTISGRLKEKACRIRLPKNIELACPTSEKNFVGGYPTGSRFAVSDTNTIVGIYWRNEWGARDLDLSATDVATCTIYNWCNKYYNGDKTIVFSGDMTNAENGAAELFYAENGCPNVMFRVSDYSRDADKAKFRFFAAKEKPGTGELLNYMVDPNNVVAEAEMVIDLANSCECMLGMLYDNTFYFTGGNTGTRRVPRAVNADKFAAIKAAELRDMILISDLLKAAGFTIVEDDDEEVDIDLSTPNIAGIVNLFA